MVANQNQSKMFKKLKMPHSIAKLAYEPVIHPRGLDSNLSIHTHFFSYSICIAFELKFVGR